MAALKCTVCGGELDVNADLSVGVCKFCESIITIPKELERKGNLYNRAVFLRQNNEFDKAVSTYEDILKEDNADAEAHWGLVLSKYGIEYVEDPRTKERIPTCHRTQVESILSDADYVAALEYADIESRKVFENEAKNIHKIQSKILEISKKEPPYDIFICYKETDDTGNRTEDSTLAQDLYYDLTKKGYKVFFARKTLESKLGTEYEPIIFAALNSAKIMIVLGTKQECFTSTWVRNEWGRFMKLSKTADKVIIPAYRGISPYELPAELSSLQSQDMSKIGFMQDLADGIEKIMKGGGIKKETAQKEVAGGGFSSASLERLLQNSQTYLKLNNYSSAEEVYTTVTKDYPEDHRGWWGLMVCKTRNFTDAFIDQSTLNVWFRYVKQLADAKDFGELEKKYVEYTKKVGDLAATEDMKATNNTINNLNSKIRSLQQEIASNEASKTNCTQNYLNIISNDDNRISEAENIISPYESALSKYSTTRLVGGILLAFGFILLSTGGWSILWGIIVGFVGFCVWCTAGSVGTGRNVRVLGKSDLEKFIQNARENLSGVKNEKNQHTSQYNQNIQDFDNTTANLKQQINVLQGKIENCKKYLELGKDHIATMFFAQKCEAFGVQQTFDNSISTLRKAAFDIQEKSAAEIVQINCPACNQPISAERNALIAKGYIICDTCGNTIEINVSGNNNSSQGNNSSQDKPLYDSFEEAFDIECPACGDSFTISESVLNSGECQCPKCGITCEWEVAYD